MVFQIDQRIQYNHCDETNSCGMRLTTDQIAAIKDLADKYFGKGAHVRLFGSRTDDSLRGGDIDLYIQTDLADVEQVVDAEIQFLVDLKRRIGDQKIDVLVDYPARERRPRIFTVAKETGIPL